MIRGTTPLIKVTLPAEMPIADYVDGTLSIAQGRVEIISKALADMTPVSEDNSFTVRLTQAETLMLDRGLTCEVQLKLIDSDGVVVASQIVRCPCGDILNEETLPHPVEEVV